MLAFTQVFTRDNACQQFEHHRIMLLQQCVHNSTICVTKICAKDHNFSHNPLFLSKMCKRAQFYNLNWGNVHKSTNTQANRITNMCEQKHKVIYNPFMLQRNVHKSSMLFITNLCSREKCTQKHILLQRYVHNSMRQRAQFS